MKRTSKDESFVVRTRRQKSCSREIFEDLPQASREEASLSVQEQPLGVGVGLLREHDVVVREHAELLARELARTLWIYYWRERQDKASVRAFVSQTAFASSRVREVGESREPSAPGRMTSGASGTP